tara:strand:- start:8917 stop:10161 length:1245 start_codon:yes stop_codon:yes gene_type:complete
MIGFKKPPIRIVLSLFFISIILILLMYVDSVSNKPAPIEEISIKKNFNNSLPMVENALFHEVKKGDSLSVIFEEKEIPLNTAYRIFNFDKNNLLSSIKPGDKMEFNYVNENIMSIEIIKDKTNSILIDLSDDISIKKQEKIIQSIKSFKIGTISSSFYQDALKIGIPESIIMDFAYIFGWDVDFIFDVRKGDRFSVIFETDYSDGEQITSGDIIFAEFVNNGESFIAQRFFDDMQGKQYFDETGNNVRKAFLRAPLDFAYISSHFNPNRMHPILHKIKAHNGVDYAARRNTPVQASGDGIISFVGEKSGYGRTVEIKHGGNIKTLYAHLERFNSRSKVGNKVKQGEIIAYVGDSGRATGTHLHFEFWQGKKRTDPVKVKLPSAKPINKNQLNEFKNLLSLNLLEINKYNSKQDE